MNEFFSVVGIEAPLRNLFPNCNHLNGALAKDAYHTHLHGVVNDSISYVGVDPLSTAIQGRPLKLGANVRYIEECVSYPTGTVHLVLHTGKSVCDIHENVAWDHIPYSTDLQQLAAPFDVVCLKTLAACSSEWRGRMGAFLRRMSAQALTHFNLNLRHSSLSTWKEALANCFDSYWSCLSCGGLFSDVNQCANDVGAYVCSRLEVLSARPAEWIGSGRRS